MGKGRGMRIFIYIVFAAIIFYLIAVRPYNDRRDRMEELAEHYFAHRGLHDNRGPAPENSMMAFRRAVNRGYGIELDVRETKDEQLVVFHDPNLLRVCGIDRKVSDMTATELGRCRICGSEETIPTLYEALDLIHGRVPIIVEIKYEGFNKVRRLCENTAFALDCYEGVTCIESFHPLVLRWFRKHHPNVLRGQLSDRFPDINPLRKVGGFLLSLCMCNFLTKPDFIAYNMKYARQLPYQVLRHMHCFGAAWTVRSENDLVEARQNFDMMIFEHFTPDQSKIPRVEKKKKRDINHMIRKHLLVSGQVQAVGFRWRATQIAQDTGVSGWVMNRDDGRVEMELQGTPEMIEETMERLKRQPYIEIDDVLEEIIPVLPHEYEFKVRY